MILFRGGNNGELPVPYTTYYKPMGDLPYINSEQGGGLIIRTELIYELPAYAYTQNVPRTQEISKVGCGHVYVYARTYVAIAS